MAGTARVSADDILAVGAWALDCTVSLAENIRHEGVYGVYFLDAEDAAGWLAGKPPERIALLIERGRLFRDRQRRRTLFLIEAACEDHLDSLTIGDRQYASAHSAATCLAAGIASEVEKFWGDIASPRGYFGQDEGEPWWRIREALTDETRQHSSAVADALNTELKRIGLLGLAHAAEGVPEDSYELTEALADRIPHEQRIADAYFGAHSRKGYLEVPDRTSEPDDAIPPAVVSSNDDRDAWIYERVCRGDAAKDILAEFNPLAKEKRWGIVSDWRSLRSAATRYAARKNLEPPPKRHVGFGR